MLCSVDKVPDQTTNKFIEKENVQEINSAAKKNDQNVNVKGLQGKC